MTVLSDSQRALLAARLRQGRTDGAAAGIPRRRPGTEELPLSFGQEQLWFIDQLAPGLSTYHIAGAVRMDGRLDVDALTTAAAGLLARHEVLRTRLVNLDDRPVQVIDEPGGVDLPVVDLTATGTPDWREAARAEAVRPFDLAAGPLLRLLLLRENDDRHVLVVTVHHTVFDGWSFAVLVQELAAFYQAALTGRPASLPELPIQFADYAVWERDRLRGDRLAELVGYWQENLRGAPVLQLPTDRPRPLVQSYAGASERVQLGRELLDGLTALARREGTTLFVTLMAAFQVLMHRYTGQDDIVVGTVSANRGRPELEPLIGYLVNTLPVRADLSGDPSFLELLGRVRTATVGAYAHQDLPFARMVDALRVPRDPGRSPLFQVGFMLAESQQHDLRAGELTWQTEELETEAAKFDLLVSAVQTGDGLGVGVSYATALFDAATVRRLLGNLDELLHGIVADPQRPVSTLPLLSAEELHAELVEWNDTAADFPVRCLHEEFAQRVAAHPDGIAVELEGDAVSYAALNERANRVAWRLRGLGVGPEVLVGVCMQRSVDRIVAVLGVLKAGGAYVPLDPQYPADRLSFMVDDARMPVVLTDGLSASALPAGLDTTVVDVDADAAALAALPGTDPDAVAQPSNVAYVIYTSGSTGRPKGVVVEHRQAVNFALAEITHWPLGPGDRVLQFASLNFDVSVLDIFGALLSGSTLVLAGSETLLSPPRLAELIRRERITFMCLPPAVLNLLADEDFGDLRVVIAGGEAFSSALVRSWARPGLRFINGYGPTETTVGATMAQCRADNPLDPPPIGLPLANYTAYVLDKRMQPVPVGVAGELHIGGSGVTRGYLHRPELTAQRFVRDPFGADPDARLYKTGDVARRLPDGNIQFLGRLDDQVKIRGLRVELGEIEAVLADHPGIAQAIVLVGTDQAGQQQLIGYARTDPGSPAVSPADLRVHLAARLPAFMVPAHLLILDAFPLNPNGKVDRSALPAPDAADGGAGFVAPRTLIETVLVDMYAGLLNLQRVGIEDNFFDLGGNSLQAMQLITRLRKDLAVDTDVTAIFLAPTPAQLTAALIDKHGLADSPLDDADLAGLGQLSAAEADELLASLDAAPAAAVAAGPLVTMSSGTRERPLFLVHAIGGTVFPYAPLARELGDTHAVYGVEAAGLRDGSTPAPSFDEMVTRYVAAVRAAAPDGPYRLAGWSMGGLVALAMARRLEESGAEVALVGLLDTPIEPADMTGWSEAELAAQFVADAARALGPEVVLPTSTGVDAQLGWLTEQLTRGAGDVAAARDEIGRRFAVFTAHAHLIAGHRPRPVRAATLVVGARDSYRLEDRWSALLGEGARIVQVPGDHYSFLQAGGVREVAAALAEAARR